MLRSISNLQDCFDRAKKAQQRPAALPGSLATCADRRAASADPGGALKLLRRLEVGSFERAAEVAIAGKAEVERQTRKITMMAEQVERSSQPQLQLVTVKRQAFDLLENLRQIDRGNPHIAGDVRQAPATSQIGGEHQFGAIHQFLAPDTAAGGVRGLVAQGATDQREGESLCFEAFNGTAIETVTKQRHERLRARINSQAWSIKHRSTFGEKVITGHQLQHRGRVDLDRQAGVATFE